MNKTQPIVSVTIPTYNEEKALPIALEALANQSYPELEVIVVDSDSTDNTKDIAKQFNAKVLNYKGKLLGARYRGFQEAKGAYILLLDADQILKNDTIERAVEEMKNYDMLILEENAHNPTTFIQKTLAEERRLLHLQKMAFDPLEGGLLPRFFRRNILNDSFKNIPSKLMPIVVHHDHHIIYYEAYNISKSVGLLRNAVYHIETESFLELLNHAYRFGKSSKLLYETGFYRELLFNKRAFQAKNILPGSNGNLMAISILRSFAYQLGYY